MKYKFLDNIKSDVMFEAYGSNLSELFSNSAEALFTVICESSKVLPKKTLKIEAVSDNEQNLIIEWLQQLIAAVDTEEMFFSKFEITEIDNKHVKAVCYGEEISPEKSGTVVKAVTYHNFKFEKTKEGYKARVSFDI